MARTEDRGSVSDERCDLTCSAALESVCFRASTLLLIERSSAVYGTPSSFLLAIAPVVVASSGGVSYFSTSCVGYMYARGSVLISIARK